MFCGKCGAKIETSTNFCPQCGAPLKADNSQPGRAPAQPDKPKKKIKFARSMASPAQKTTDTIHAILYLPNFVLALLWLSDSIAASGMSAHETTTLATIFGQGLFLVTLAFAFFTPAISNIMLSGHMAKQDEKINAPVLPWLYLIWSIVFFVLGLAAVTDEISRYNGLLKVGPTAMGWLYIMACIALAGLVITLTVIYMKSRTGENTRRNP